METRIRRQNEASVASALAIAEAVAAEEAAEVASIIAADAVESAVIAAAAAADATYAVAGLTGAFTSNVRKHYTYNTHIGMNC